MKKILAAAAFALLSGPVATFACDGGTAGFDLPPPSVPDPSTVQSVVNALSNSPALFIGLALGTIMGAVLARRRTSSKAASVLENPAA